jgi:hypothetical protein
VRGAHQDVDGPRYLHTYILDAIPGYLNTAGKGSFRDGGQSI